MEIISKILQKSVLAILVVILVGCNDDFPISPKTDSWQGDDKLLVSFNFVEDTGMGSRAIDVPIDEGTATTYTIKDFIVFQFDENGNRLVPPAYYNFTADAGSIDSQTIPVVLPHSAGIEYTLVVLANTHDQFMADVDFANVTTLDRLMEQYYTIGSLNDTYRSNNSSNDLLMNGFATLTYETASSRHIEMDLYRNVAKLTVNVQNMTGSGVTLNSLQVKSVSPKIDYFPSLIKEKKESILASPYPLNSQFPVIDYDIDDCTMEPGGEAKTFTYYLPCHLLGNTESTASKDKGANVPDYATFVELYGTSSDEQKFACYRFYIGENMMNNFDIEPNHHYNLQIKISNITSSMLEDSRVELYDAVITEPEANSYIVNPLPSEKQRMYLIPVADRINTYWLNEKDAGNISTATGMTISKDDHWAADIIWQSSDQQMIEFYDASNVITANEGRKSPEYKGMVPLRIKPKKGAEGNVLVGVYRTDQPNADDPDKREYSWSWHLWITDYNPDECVGQDWNDRYKIVLKSGGEVHHYTGTYWDADNATFHNKWIMDRNFGSFANHGWNKNAFGLYYFFGLQIPYPMPKMNYHKYDANSDTFVDFAGVSFSSVARSRDQLIKNPRILSTTLLLNNTYYYNLWDNPYWNVDENGKQKGKSFFDPCPPGWKVPQRYFLDKNCKTKAVRIPIGNSTIITGYNLYFDGDYSGNNVAWYLNPERGGSSWNADHYSDPCYWTTNTGSFVGWPEEDACYVNLFESGAHYWASGRSSTYNIRAIQE